MDSSRVSRVLTCLQHELHCEEMHLLHVPYIEHSSYRAVAQLVLNGTDTAVDDILGDTHFTFQFVNDTFVHFALIWRMSYFAMNFLIFLWFAYRTRDLPWQLWSVEQKWVIVLLFALLLYNDPLYPMQFIVNHFLVSFLHEALTVTFVSLLLLFWLSVLDGIRAQEETNAEPDRKMRMFYMPKIVFVLWLWMLILFCYCWIASHRLSDPEKADWADFSLYNTVGGALLVMMAIYVAWLAVILIRSFSNTSLYPFIGIRIKFFAVSGIVVMALTLTAPIINIMFPAVNNAGLVIGYLCLYNSYVYLLTIAYVPVVPPHDTSVKFDEIEMARLDLPKNGDGLNLEEEEEM